MEVSRETTLAELLKNKKAVEVLSKFGVPCLFCPMAAYEMSRLKIGDIAEMYGIDLEKLLEELKKIE